MSSALVNVNDWLGDNIPTDSLNDYIYLADKDVGVDLEAFMCISTINTRFKLD